jgi:hypothetical protein
MEKEVGGLFFAIVILVFLLSGIFAAPSPVPAGTCAIVPKADCPESTDNTGAHVLMGLSSATNAHGEFPYSAYPYVLCCAFGDGMNVTECIDNPNPIIKLSSATNAHAEIRTGSAYNTVKICYEDLQCIGTTSNCGSGDALNYRVGFISLSGTTNAHIGAIGDYPTKICCASKTFASCTISDAKWNKDTANEGERVYLNVQGSPECSGKSIKFNVTYTKDGNPTDVTNQPVSVSFSGANGLGVWTAEYRAGGLFGLGNTEYSFDTSLTKNPLVAKSSDATLPVIKRDWTVYTGVTACDDYQNKDDCESDIMTVAPTSNPPEIDCSNESFACGCVWNNDSGTCGFGYTEITADTCGKPIAGEGCNYGCTLCKDPTSGLYCTVGSTCPSEQIPPSNGDKICDFGEGCLSTDCTDGDQDTCASGLYCVSGKCLSVEGPSLTAGQCIISQTVEKECDAEPVGSKIVVWHTTYTGEQSGTRYESCIAKNGKKATIPCPAQVQLPFFDYIGIITTVLAIAGIYIAIFFKKKFKKNKN